MKIYLYENSFFFVVVFELEKLMSTETRYCRLKNNLTVRTFHNIKCEEKKHKHANTFL